MKLILLFSLWIMMSYPAMGMDAQGFCEGPDDHSDCIVKPAGDSESVQFERAVASAKNEPQVHLVGSKMGCLQSPTGNLYKESMATINSAVKHLNEDFGPSDSGKRWYIVSCD